MEPLLTKITFPPIRFCIGIFFTARLKLQFLPRRSPSLLSFQHGLLPLIRILFVNLHFRFLYRVLLDTSFLTLILWKELIVTLSWLLNLYEGVMILLPPIILQVGRKSGVGRNSEVGCNSGVIVGRNSGVV